jgi:E3 ubiquitin-protein ligase BRE1
MESRKRPQSDDGRPAVLKKRIVSDSNGTPVVNGATYDQHDSAHPDPDPVEVFSLFLSFKRSSTASAALQEGGYFQEDEALRAGAPARPWTNNRAREEKVDVRSGLGRHKCLLGPGTAAVRPPSCVCLTFTQLIETIRLLARPEDLPQPDHGKHLSLPLHLHPRSLLTHSSSELFSIKAYLSEVPPPDVDAALEHSRVATHNLVSRFAQLHRPSNTSLFHDEMYSKCQTAQTEVGTLCSFVVRYF